MPLKMPIAGHIGETSGTPVASRCGFFNPYTFSNIYDSAQEQGRLCRGCKRNERTMPSAAYKFGETAQRGFPKKMKDFTANGLVPGERFNSLNNDTCLISHVHHRSPSNTPPEKGENHAVSERVDGKCRSPLSLPSQSAVNFQISQLSPEFNCQETAQWLRKNSFGNYVSTFANFSGADILRLTRDDLIQICGLADGIRLLYALHLKAIVRLTLYVCTPSSTIYHAVYLNDGGRNDLTRKLAALIGIHQNQIHDLFLQGPQEIRVLITDEVVSNLKDESMFSVEVLKDETRSRFILLLKPQPQPS